MARKLAPLQQRRGLKALAEAFGAEVGITHRALPDAVLCAQVFCALFKRLGANAPTVGEAVALLSPRRRAPRPKPARIRRPVERRPDLRGLTRGPGVYVFRDADGHPLYVGKSVRVRDRARQHFTTGAAWTARAEHVDCEETESELGALLLEHRLIRALKPPANKRGVRDPDGHVYVRCRLDIAFPILEVAREPAAGNAVCIGPVRGQAAASELVEQLNSLFGLRHCGRKLSRRYWPSAYGQMGRCLSPCLGDLDPNLYRERLEQALGLFFDAGDGARALLDHVEGQMHAASAERNYERAAALRRRQERLETLLARLGGVLRAVHAGSRLVVAAHPQQRGHGDAIWIAGGRVVDWARMPAAREEVAARTEDALRAAPSQRSLGAWLVPEELEEVRLVGGWLAANGARVLELEPAPPAQRVEAFLAAALA
jgi:DNA polymerase-3 subunit epsilon